MRTLLVALCVSLAVGQAVAADGRPAKQLFGSVAVPADMPARSIGSYARGCLAGGVALPIDGPAWQVMRLSRNRNWGNPVLVDFLDRFARAVAADGYPGLLVGDMAQPRGGPMLTGHASHQIGLDADIWFLPMPDYTQSRDEREKKSAVSLLIPGKLKVDPARWSPRVPAILKRAASYPEVERIFVNPAIKKALCESAETDRGWLRKVRPWAGHDAHFHVRLACPVGVAGCKPQAAVGPGDGCGAELDEWFKPPPPPPPKPPKPVKPPPPPRELTLADLPEACEGVLQSGLGRSAAAALGMPMPRLRPKTGGASVN